MMKPANANAFGGLITIAKEEFFKMLQEVVVLYLNCLFKIHLKDLKEAKQRRVLGINLHIRTRDFLLGNRTVVDSVTAT
jgi:shikimate kinase